MWRILLSISFFIIITINGYGQTSVEKWSFNQLDSYLNETSEKVKVVNFWATWCAPCIKEMPYFEQLAQSYGEDVEVLFVSLDFADLLDRKVIPFVKKKNIKSEVVLLDDGNYNEWIGKVSPEWSGAIPATLIINYSSNKRKFYEQEFDYNALEKEYLLNKNQ